MSENNFENKFKDIRNQKLKLDIKEKLYEKEADLALLILYSIEKEGQINHKEIQEIARKVFEEVLL